MGMKGPRIMKAYLPLVDNGGRMLTVKPQSESNYLQNTFKKDSDQVCILENKPPIWSKKFNTFILDFNFRVTQPSPKNFQLINPDNRNISLKQPIKLYYNSVK
jgi:hypothetical protein